MHIACSAVAHAHAKRPLLVSSITIILFLTWSSKQLKTKFNILVNSSSTLSYVVLCSFFSACLSYNRNSNIKVFFFPFFDSIMYYFTFTLFSVSATITDIAKTIRCTMKKVRKIWTTISHFDVCWPSTAVTSQVKTHLPADPTICYCGVSTFQPAGSTCATFVFRWTWSWHSCAGGPSKRNQPGPIPLSQWLPTSYVIFLV